MAMHVMIREAMCRTIRAREHLAKERAIILFGVGASIDCNETKVGANGVLLGEAEPNPAARATSVWSIAFAGPLRKA